MATVKEIYTYLDQLAPFSLQMDFDNSGFLVGRGEAEVKKLMIALDITNDVVAEAREASCDLIISHHPIIFHPAKAITDAEPTGSCILSLIENHIADICAHTNMDVAEYGVNDALAQALQLTELSVLHQEGVDHQGKPYGIGRIGTVARHMTAKDFSLQVQNQLHAFGLRLEDAGRPVKKVAVGGGACGEYLFEAAQKGCDTFVTSDVKYNTFLDARALEINLIDAGHFSTENVICPILSQWITAKFPGIETMISQNHKEVFSCI